MEKPNLKRHYHWKHAKIDELHGQVLLDKVKALQSLLSEKQVLQNYILTETMLCKFCDEQAGSLEAELSFRRIICE